MKQRQEIVDKDSPLSISLQCELLSLHRSGLYYKARGEKEENLKLMRLMDEHFLKYPFKGVRKMTVWLQEQGYRVNRKRVGRLYKLMGLQTIYRKPWLSWPDKKNKIYPYLLKGLSVVRPNQVWATDITYIPMKKGFLYLIAIIDLYSRFVLSWSVSNSMDAAWCSGVLKETIARYGKPEIFNTDQGSQFTSEDFVGILLQHQIKVSMDGKGRALDNIFVERLWRTVKYEHVYLNPATDGVELYNGLQEYFEFYNCARHHQSLDYQTPEQVYTGTYTELLKEAA
jgi:putative transposase